MENDSARPVPRVAHPQRRHDDQQPGCYAWPRADRVAVCRARVVRSEAPRRVRSPRLSEMEDVRQAERPPRTQATRAQVQDKNNRQEEGAGATTLSHRTRREGVAVSGPVHAHEAPRPRNVS